MQWGGRYEFTVQTLKGLTCSRLFRLCSTLCIRKSDTAGASLAIEGLAFSADRFLFFFMKFGFKSQMACTS
jgi:hypothetical protein